MEKAIITLVFAAIEAWRIFANKPAGWEPDASDWARLRQNNRLTAADYEAASQALSASAAKTSTDPVLAPPPQ